jgi:hypothetical protein
MEALAATLRTSGCTVAVTITSRTERVAGTFTVSSQIVWLARERARWAEARRRDRRSSRRGRVRAGSLPSPSATSWRTDRTSAPSRLTATEPSHDVPEIALGSGAPPWTLRVRVERVRRAQAGPRLHEGRPHDHSGGRERGPHEPIGAGGELQARPGRGGFGRASRAEHAVLVDMRR